MDRRRALGIGLVVVAGASFASGSIFATLSYAEGLDWLTLLGWRFLIGAGLAWAWVALSSSRRASVRGLSRRQLAVTLGLGALYTANAGTYYAGIETIPASLAGVIVYIYPVFVALLSLRFAHAPAGPAAVVRPGPGGRSASCWRLAASTSATDLPVEGILLILASAVVYSVWIVLSARLSGERRDRLASDMPADAPAARDAAGTTAVMMSGTAVVFAVMAAVARPATRPADRPGVCLALPDRHRLPRLVPGHPGAVRRGSSDRGRAGRAGQHGRTGLHRRPVVPGPRSAPCADPAASAPGSILIGVIIAQTAPRPRGAPEPATPLEAEVEG